MTQIKTAAACLAALAGIAMAAPVSAQSASVENTPEWFNGSRVQVMTRYNPTKYLPLETTQTDQSVAQARDLRRSAFWDFCNHVGDLGLKVHTRWINGQARKPWWPTETLSGPNPGNAAYEDVARSLISYSHEECGQRIIFYYRQQDDQWAESHDDRWIAKDFKGDSIASNPDEAGVPEARRMYGSWMSLAADGYSKLISDRVIELAERGLDGVYFDWKQIPPTGDFSEAAVNKYEAWYGRDLIADAEANVASVDKFWLDLQERHFKSIRRALDDAGHDTILLISVNGMSLKRLRGSAHTAKYEPGFARYLGGVESSATILTDVIGGYPQVWVKNKVIGATANASTRGYDDLFLAFDSPTKIARYLSYGAIYNRDIREGWETSHVEFRRRVEAGVEPLIDESLFPRTALDRKAVPLELYDEAEKFFRSNLQLFELGRSISPAMQAASPFRYARVALRGDFSIKNTPRKESGAANAMNSRVAGTWNTLNKAHVPTGYISFDQILEEDGIDPLTRVIVFPLHDRSRVMEASSAEYVAIGSALKAFEARGGWVVFKDDIAAGDLVTLVKNNETTERRERPGIKVVVSQDTVKVVPYLKNAGDGLVLNLAGRNLNGVTLELFDALFRNTGTGELVRVVESVTGEEILPIRNNADTGWLISVPSGKATDFANMRQLVIDTQ